MHLTILLVSCGSSMRNILPFQNRQSATNETEASSDQSPRLTNVAANVPHIFNGFFN